MSIILLLVLFFLYLNLRNASQDWRLAAVSAAVVFGLLLVMLTEALSVFRALARGPLLVCWAAVLLVLVGLWLWRGGRPRLPRFRTQLTPVGIGIGAVLAVIGVIGGIAPPNSWDAMTYHLSRVWMWAYYGSVAHYPLFDTRHLYNPPFTEFVQLHILLLDNGDNATNLVQWVALILGVVAASYAASLLGAGRRGQMLAGAFTVSIPIAVQQASGAKNDLQVAVWVLCVLVYALLLIQRPAYSQTRYLVLGLAGSTALATFTKLTGYIFALPILLWVGVAWLTAGRWRVFVIAVVVGMSVLALNGPHFARNDAAFGNPISDPSDSSTIIVERVTLPATVSIATRNLLANALVPTSVSPRVYGALEQLHSWLGLGLNDASTTFEEREFVFVEWQYVFNESRTPNPLHVVVLILAFGVMLARARQMTGAVFALALVVLLQALLFSSLIAWQTFTTRFQLSIFLTAAVLVAVTFEHGLPKWGPPVTSGILLAGAVPWLVNGHPRTFISWERTGTTAMTSVPRDQGYFLRKLDLYPHHEAVMDYLAEMDDCRDVGLILQDEWQYPILRGIEQVIPDARVQYIDAVQPLAAWYERPPYDDFEPCVVIGAIKADDISRWLGGRQALRVVRAERYTVHRLSGFVGSEYANDRRTVQVFPQPEARAFHVYSDCVEASCRLVTIIEIDALAPGNETQTFAADDGWRAEVTYLGQSETGFERYRVAIYDAAGERVDDGMRLLLGEDLVTWEDAS